MTAGVSYTPTVSIESKHYNVKEHDFSSTDSLGEGTLVSAELTA